MYSRRLGRPWPDLAAMTFPRPVMAALAIAVGLSLVGGLIGIIAGVLAASLLMAYGVLGLAVLHAVTRRIVITSYSIHYTKLYERHHHRRARAR